MNTISKYYKLSLILGLLLFFNSCEQEDNLRFTQPEAAFQLETPSASNIFLNFNLPDNPAFTLNWKDDLTGSSNYTIQMSPEIEFEDPINLGTSDDNTFSMTVSDFNELLSNAGIESFSNTPIFMRVLADSTESNVVNFSVNSFPENNPVIESPDSSFSVVLSSDMSGDNALTVSWNDPDFSENNTTEVNYTVEAALTDTDFEDAQQMGMTQENSLSLTHFELNDIALEAGLEAETQGSLDMRIKSVVETTNGEIERVSNPVTVDITPYPGALTNLYLVGSATAANWNNDNNNPPMVRDPNNPNLYTYTGKFGNDIFKVLEQRGAWQPQWGVGPNGNLAGSEDLGQDPGNFEITNGEGYYTLTLDLANLTYSIDPFDETGAATYSTIGIIGSGTTGDGSGWNQDVDLTKSTFDPHLWYITDIQLFDGESKFRAGNDWATNWGNDTELTGTGTIDGANIPISAGTYDVWFNDIDGTYVFLPQEE